MDKQEFLERSRMGRERRTRERMEQVLELLGKGYSWRRIAQRFGLVDVRGFKLRVRRYCEEHGLEVPEAPDLDSAVLSALDELAAKLAEIRGRYE